MNYSVYHIMFPSGKAYIGVTANLKKRLVQHKYNKKALVGRAFAKYGSWKVTTLAISDEDYAYDLERRAIKSFKTLSPKGYNLMDGGMGGRHWSEESREKASKSQIGTKHSQETKAKMSIARKGKKRAPFVIKNKGPMSNEQKQKLSEIKQGVPILKARGIKRSKEVRLKMSLAQTARWARWRIQNPAC